MRAEQDYPHGMSGVSYYYTEAENTELIVTSGQARDYPWHMHTRHWTVGVVRQGAVCLTTEAVCQGSGQRLDQRLGQRLNQHLGPGQSFCLRPYAPHSLHVEAESALLVACFDQHSALLLKNTPDAFLRHIPGLRGEEMHRLAETVASCTPPAIASDHAAHGPTAPPSLCGAAIREVMRLLLASPGEAMSMEHMAAHAGYSPWHFLRAFQKMTGMTPHAFQQLCRLRLLRALLRADTAASMAAVSAGFADQSHMHKVFKRHHGMTPGAFKKASVRLEL